MDIYDASGYFLRAFYFRSLHRNICVSGIRCLQAFQFAFGYLDRISHLETYFT